MLATICPSTNHWNCIEAVSSLFWALDRLSNVIVQGPQLVVSIGEKAIVGCGYTMISRVSESGHKPSTCVVSKTIE